MHAGFENKIWKKIRRRFSTVTLLSMLQDSRKEMKSNVMN